jgi:hypothetical protein
MAYSILSLDGGGSWSVIQAYVLHDLYGNCSGHELLRRFNLVIANSGGSLVLACLCHDMKLTEIISVFEDEQSRKKVFSELTFGEKLVPARNRLSLFRDLIGIGPRYKTSRKLEGLFEVLSAHDHLFQSGKIDRPIAAQFLDELPELIGKPGLQILICGFDYFRERVSFFRSDLDSNTDRFSKAKQFRISLGHAIHASSNAPVNYFDEPATVSIHRRESKERRITWYWDGAVAGFNNPVLAGLVEAVTNGKGRSMKDYRVLSLGTGLRQKAVLTDYSTSTDPDLRDLYRKNLDNPYVITDTGFRFLHDIRKISGSILSDPPDAASFIACSFLHPSLVENKLNMVRINPCITPVADNGIYRAPVLYRNREDEFLALMDLDMDAVEQQEIDMISDYVKTFIRMELPPIANQFIRGDAEGEHLGYGTYGDAKARWMEIMDKEPGKDRMGSFD